MKVSQAVILAAGKGTRILPISLNYPKPLLPVLNKPILVYQIEALKKAGVLDIYIVISEAGGIIREIFGDGSKFGVKISYVVDEAPEGIASSLLKAKSKIKNPFVLFLGDIFAEKINIGRSLKKFTEGKLEGLIVGRRERRSELVRKNFEMIVDNLGLVRNVIEKPKKVQGKLKGCGFYVFSTSIFDAISKTKKSKLRGEYEITDAIGKFINDGARVGHDIWKGQDFNLSYPSDLLECNLFMLKKKQLKFLTGRFTKLHPDVKLVRTIIGDRAEVVNPMVLEKCLVFGGTKLKEKDRRFSNMIFADRFEIAVN